MATFDVFSSTRATCVNTLVLKCSLALLLCHTHTQCLRLKAICNSITGCAECLMLLSLFSVAPTILILPSNNVVQGVMNNKYM